VTRITIGEEGRVAIEAAETIHKTLVLFDGVAIGMVGKLSMIFDKDNESPMLDMSIFKGKGFEPPTDFINYMKDAGFGIRFTEIHPGFFPEIH
jgi:hypothetical protein